MIMCIAELICNIVLEKHEFKPPFGTASKGSKYTWLVARWVDREYGQVKE